MSELQKVYDMMRESSNQKIIETLLIALKDEGKIAGRYVVDTSK